MSESLVRQRKDESEYASQPRNCEEAPCHLQDMVEDTDADDPHEVPVESVRVVITHRFLVGNHRGGDVAPGEEDPSEDVHPQESDSTYNGTDPVKLQHLDFLS